MSNFGMIARNPGSILHRLANEFFSRPPSSNRSWFSQVRDICLMYQLPHPIAIMSSSVSKTYKTLTKKSILSYWESRLRLDVESLPSLKYFNANFMSLKSPHPLWVSAGSSSDEVSKAIIQAQMLSGRYRTELLCSHWSGNSQGFCLTPQCKENHIVEDIEHILAWCSSLEPSRLKLVNFTKSFSLAHPILSPILEKYCLQVNPLFCQFLLDCSCLPDVITLSQTHGPILLHQLLYVGRTWC